MAVRRARPALGPVEGFRLKDTLHHAYARGPLGAEPPPDDELQTLRAALGWWHEFAVEVTADFDRQQRRLLKPATLTTHDAAYAFRVATWCEYLMRELAWVAMGSHREAMVRVSNGTATEHDQVIARTRPAAPEGPCPKPDEAPAGWPVAMSCDGRKAQFYALRHHEAKAVR